MRSIILSAGLAMALSACGSRDDDANTPAPGNFVPPVTQAPTPVAGQDNRTPLTAYVGRYPRDAVEGVAFFDRTEVANALIEVVPEERLRHLITGRDVVATPIFRQGKMIAAHGCEPHNCGDHDWTVLVSVDGNRESATVCHHDAATMGDRSRWMTRAGARNRAGDCPSV